MALETATFVSDLVPSNPVGGTDQIAQGDDHLRLLKAVMQSTFPNASKAFRFPQILTKNIDYNMLVGDDNSIVFVDSSGASRAIALPNTGTIAAGFKTTIFKTSASNSVTISTPGAETINGANTYTLSALYEFVSVEFDGTNWYITGYPASILLTSANSWSATQSIAALLDVQQTLRLSGDISPTQLSANTDDWAPTNLATASVIRVSTDASRNLTGLTGGADGRVILLTNVGANNLVLVHDATSTAANRFYCPNSANLTLLPNTSVWLWYDATSSRWRVIQIAASTSPAFRATTATAQTLTASTWVKIQFGTETFDNNSNYDNATNYRFLPTVAGKYQINAILSCAALTKDNLFKLAIYKNGSAVAVRFIYNVTSGADKDFDLSISDVLDMNGTTDYVEVFAWCDDTSPCTLMNDATLNVFSASKVG